MGQLFSGGGSNEFCPVGFIRGARSLFISCKGAQSLLQHLRRFSLASPRWRRKLRIFEAGQCCEAKGLSALKRHCRSEPLRILHSVGLDDLGLGLTRLTRLSSQWPHGWPWGRAEHYALRRSLASCSSSLPKSSRQFNAVDCCDGAEPSAASKNVIMQQEEASPPPFHFRCKVQKAAGLLVELSSALWCRGLQGREAPSKDFSTTARYIWSGFAPPPPPGRSMVWSGRGGGPAVGAVPGWWGGAAARKGSRASSTQAINPVT